MRVITQLYPNSREIVIPRPIRRLLHQSIDRRRYILVTRHVSQVTYPRQHTYCIELPMTYWDLLGQYVEDLKDRMTSRALP